MPKHLFVYGTLHPDRAPAEIADVIRPLREVGVGMISGTKYDLGDYPGVVQHPGSEDKVEGTIFAMPDDADLLAALDRYEDYRPGDPANSLFLRVQLPVTLADATLLDCWVYLYNQPI